MKASLNREERWGKEKRRGDKEKGGSKDKGKREWSEYTGISLRVAILSSRMVQNILHKLLCPGI